MGYDVTQELADRNLTNLRLAGYSMQENIGNLLKG